MEMAGLSNTIIEFLLLTSALVFSLGLLSFLALKILKIHGNPKLWTYALLLIIPLAYPLQTFFPAPIEVPVPLKTRHFIDLHLTETSAAENNVSNNNSFLSKNTDGTNQTGDRETTFSGGDAPNSNTTIRPVRASSRFFGNWKIVAVSAWLAVFLYFLVRLTAMVYNTHRFTRLLDPVTDTKILELLRKCALETGLRRAPRLLTLDQLPTPMVMGFFKPRILLPRHLLKPEFREGLRFTLLHELKHVHQRHNWWLLIESIISAAYFFHPVIHWAKKRIREELEYICDRHVVHITNKSIPYADFLLHEIWQRKRERNLVLALPFISGGKKTTNRIHAILENTGPTPFARIRGVFALCFILVSFVSLLLCNVAPSAQDSEQASHKTTAVTTGAPDNASVNTRMDGMEKEAPEPMQYAGISRKEDDSFPGLTEKPSGDNSAILRQTATPGAMAETHGVDTPATLDEQKRYDLLLERENPSVLMDETGVRAKETPAGQIISDPIQTAPNIDSEDVIILAQYDAPRTFAAKLSTISETGSTGPKTENSTFYTQQGTSHYLQGRIDEAIADYSKAIDMNAGSAVAYNNRGSAYCKKGQIDEALSDFNKAIEIIPRFAAAYANRGYAFFKIDRYRKAISDLDTALELDPVNADIYYIRGNAYYRTGRIDRAVSDFNMAIELNPGYITKMPKGVIPAHKREDVDYTSDAEESLKWHHGSLPLHYWDTARIRDVESKASNLYRIKKKGI